MFILVLSGNVFWYWNLRYVLTGLFTNMTQLTMCDESIFMSYEKCNN